MVSQSLKMTLILAVMANAPNSVRHDGFDISLRSPSRVEIRPYQPVYVVFDIVCLGASACARESEVPRSLACDVAVDDRKYGCSGPDSNAVAVFGPQIVSKDGTNDASEDRAVTAILYWNSETRSFLFRASNIMTAA